MVELKAPTNIVCGQPIAVGFSADERVAGRVRLTAGTELVSFVLERDDRTSEAGTGHRVRGRQGTFRILEWGEHPAGTELVLRFEGAKLWMTVTD